MVHLDASTPIPGQALFDGTHGPTAALDWSGLTDLRFIANSVGILLLVAGALVERSPKVGNSWGVAALGGLILFIGGEGLIHLIWGEGGSPRALASGGGRIG